MTRISAALLLTGALVLGSCATSAGSTAAPDRGPDRGPGRGPGETRTVTVRTSWGLHLTEGALAKVRLVTRAGTVLTPRRGGGPDDRALVFDDVPAGHYRLTAALQPCDGNCSVLDQPMLACDAPVQVSGDLAVRVRWPGPEPRPCSVRAS